MPSPYSPSVLDDSGLMSRLRDDDASALDELVARHWSALVSYARGVVPDEDAALDIAQETFIRLWLRRRDWVAGGSVRVWLFRTARNLSISEHRKREVRAQWSVRNGGAPKPPRTPLQDAEEDELRRAVAAALEQLSPRRREAFTLFYLRDLSYRETAEVMGIREQSVANHLQAALADLRVALGRFFPALTRAESTGTSRSAAAGTSGAARSHEPPRDGDE